MTDESFEKEISTVCSEYIDDIKYLKQQQWKVVNYCLLLYIVIFYTQTEYFIKVLSQDKYGFDNFAHILSIAIALICLYFISNFQGNLQKNRIRLILARYQYCDRRTLISLGLPLDKDKTKTFLEKQLNFFHDLSYLLTFAFLILIAFAIIILIISDDLYITLASVFLMFVYFLLFCSFRLIKNNNFKKEAEEKILSLSVSSNRNQNTQNQNQK
jgi:uncharacterized membrane protein YqjE